ncbi:MAG: hypothetical protein PHR53_03425 [Bacteroidales bacterium]|nr:hypothetical protein [Bacteroidales bacterium]
MDKKIFLITKIITWVIMGLSVILGIMLIAQSSDLKKVTEESLNSSLISYSFYLCYLAVAIAIIVTLIFPIINTITNPKQLLRVLFLFIGFVVIGVISYFMEKFGSNELSTTELMRLNTSEQTAMWVGVGINFTYIMFLLSIIVFIYTAVRNLLKK